MLIPLIYYLWQYPEVTCECRVQGRSGGDMNDSARSRAFDGYLRSNTERCSFWIL